MRIKWAIIGEATFGGKQVRHTFRQNPMKKCRVRHGQAPPYTKGLLHEQRAARVLPSGTDNESPPSRSRHRDVF